MGTQLISQESISWQKLAPFLDGPIRVRLSPGAKKSIRESNKFTVLEGRILEVSKQIDDIFTEGMLSRDLLDKDPSASFSKYFIAEFEDTMFLLDEAVTIAIMSAPEHQDLLFSAVNKFKDYLFKANGGN